MAFKEGDRVVWEKKPNEKWKVHYLWNEEYIQIIHHERGGFASIRVPISEIKPFDRYGETKQAVREVLLSEEFLLAFAKVLWGTPTPIMTGSVDDLAVVYDFNKDGYKGANITSKRTEGNDER